MPVKDEDRKVVEELFKAMQAGPDGEEALMALFHEDAVFTEPFSGQPRTHLWKAGNPRQLSGYVERARTRTQPRARPRGPRG